jgi:hypothetical protein
LSLEPGKTYVTIEGDAAAVAAARDLVHALVDANSQARERGAGQSLDTTRCTPSGGEKGEQDEDEK